MCLQRPVTSCPICGKLCTNNNIKRHIVSHTTHPEYQKKIIGVAKTYKLDHNDLFCKFCGKALISKNALIQHEIRCANNPNKLLTKHNSTGSGKKLVAWNKGLTKETDSRILKGCLTFITNHKQGKHKYRTGECNPSHKQAVRDKISLTCLRKSKNGTWHTSLAKELHYNYKGNDLHGTWELRYALYLDKNNRIWVRNKERFEYTYKNKVRYYTPDFYLVDTNEYIEIKGYCSGKDYAKWKQFPTTEKLIVLREKDLKLLGILNIDITNYVK